MRLTYKQLDPTVAGCQVLARQSSSKWVVARGRVWAWICISVASCKFWINHWLRVEYFQLSEAYEGTQEKILRRKTGEASLASHWIGFHCFLMSNQEYTNVSSRSIVSIQKDLRANECNLSHQWSIISSYTWIGFSILKRIKKHINTKRYCLRSWIVDTKSMLLEPRPGSIWRRCYSYVISTLETIAST